ncbi:MAG: hypothetical protein WKF61_01140 [Luteimonas sp.]
MAIVVIDEDRATVYTALGDVHWNAWKFKSRLTRHGRWTLAVWMVPA